MEAEISAQIGAGQRRGAPRRARRTETATAQRALGDAGRARSSWRSRKRARAGATSRASWSRANAAEQALVAVVMEAYVNGVSTRKVDRLVEQLGISAMSKDRVSRLCRALDEQVQRLPRAPAGGRLPLPVAGRQAASRSATAATSAPRRW